MKRRFTLILTILLVVVLVACKKNVTEEGKDVASMQESLYTNEGIGTGEVEEWIGEYTFQESLTDPLMLMDYKIDIYKTDEGKYHANIIINGQQTAAAILANVSGDKDKIELTFLEYLPDHISGGYADGIQGDSLLKFWKDKEKMYTDWGKIQPMLEENDESGKEYFIGTK
ncbi:MAG: DUF5991 domain-containing protein [Lachnospiraceae bacterium]|nr:DUF5991 domain-containing protein [Lachnospiraceae bacterium]MCI7595012.1 DUF5991 domain-containing protein [Lachnospiraceae bacterium]